MSTIYISVNTWISNSINYKIKTNIKPNNFKKSLLKISPKIWIKDLRKMKNKNKTMRMVKKKYRLFLTSVDLEFDYEELQTWTLDATWIIVSIVIIMNGRKRMMCIYNIVWIISMISYLQSIWQKMCLF